MPTFRVALFLLFLRHDNNNKPYGRRRRLLNRNSPRPAATRGPTRGDGVGGQWGGVYIMHSQRWDTAEFTGSEHVRSYFIVRGYITRPNEYARLRFCCVWNWVTFSRRICRARGVFPSHTHTHTNVRAAPELNCSYIYTNTRPRSVHAYNTVCVCCRVFAQHTGRCNRSSALVFRFPKVYAKPRWTTTVYNIPVRHVYYV